VKGFSCLPVSARKELSNIRGPGSLPRSVHGCLIKRLGELGFPVIVFDILFAMEGIDNDDKILAQAIKEHGATAILVGLERSTVRNGASELLVERQVKPIASFAEIAAATGTFVVPRSGGPVYGYWRKIAGFEDARPLPDEAFDLYSSISSKRHVDDKGKPEFEYLWLYGPPGSITIISASDILSAEIPESVRTAAPESTAFVGASDPTMTNFPDTFPSFFRGPSGAGISGVELASTAFLNQMRGELLRPLSPTANSMTIIFMAFALGFIARARSGIAILAVPAAAAFYLAGATLAFAQMRLSLPIASPIFVAAPAAFLLAVLIRYRIARTLLMRLAPAPVARRMMRRGTDHRSDVVSDEATVAFFDLIGSTEIAEKIPPIEFSTLLNKYYDTVTSFVEMHDGQITAFSGDGVMAVFSQTDSGADHAANACKAAINVIHGFRDFNAENEKSGMPALHLRIGLNSGGVAEGEIGARDRFNFSVVGDVVNLASRLEQLGKTVFPGETDVIMVGEATWQLAERPGLPFADCGSHRIRGRANPERVYQLLVE
jgi:adenylate cyclase